MACWVGWASMPSTMMWYIVIDRARLIFDRSFLRRLATSSRWLNVLRWPHVMCGSVARMPPPIVPSPSPTTSSMKRLKNTAWRASSTCWVARKYFCSSSGAASM